jgi:hypothetical protein
MGLNLASPTTFGSSETRGFAGAVNSILVAVLHQRALAGCYRSAYALNTLALSSFMSRGQSTAAIAKTRRAN